MRKWFSSPTLLKLFVGQHIVNGLSVAVAVVAVAALGSALLGLNSGQIAMLGAIAASISDFPAPWRGKARTLLIGFSFALASTCVIQLAGASQLAQLVVFAGVGFCAGMVTGYGAWALALSAQMLVPMVLIVSVPRSDFAASLHVEAVFAFGGFAYIALALIATRLSGAGERRLMASECCREVAAYLRTIARFTDLQIDLNEVYGAAIRQQAALADQLQAARALLLERPRETPERVRLSATIGTLLDVFDALIAAQCDLPRLREIAAARTLMARLGVAMRAAALDLQHLSLQLLTSKQPTLPPGHPVATNAMLREAARIVEAGEMDDADTRVVEASAQRLRYARERILQVEHALCDDAAAEAVLRGINLSAFAPSRSYDPRQLIAHLTPDSPVFRFAVRLSAAIAAAAVVAVSLGGSHHGYWVLLTTSVIMRASYGWTRKRRDDRIVGTLIGCLIASIVAPYLSMTGSLLLLGFAIAVMHGFVRSNYRLASVAASLMALIALHLVDPTESVPVVTRLADTLIGAAIAHLFSHVLPSWESTQAQGLAVRLLARIGAFAAVALRTDAPEQDYRLARRALIEAIAALSDSASRMGGEPRAARRGLEEMASMLIAAYALVAHLAAMRLAMRTGVGGAPSQTQATRAWLKATLAADAPASQAGADGAAVEAPLQQATLALVAAAQTYQHAAGSD